MADLNLIKKPVWLYTSLGQTSLTVCSDMLQIVFFNCTKKDCFIICWSGLLLSYILTNHGRRELIKKPVWLYTSLGQTSLTVCSDV